jgi:hypothetical protein
LKIDAKISIMVLFNMLALKKISNNPVIALAQHITASLDKMIFDGINFLFK